MNADKPTINLDAPDVEARTLAALTAAHYHHTVKGTHLHLSWWHAGSLFPQQMRGTVADRRAVLRSAATFVDSTGKGRTPPPSLLDAVLPRLPWAPNVKEASAADGLLFRWVVPRFTDAHRLNHEWMLAAATAIRQLGIKEVEKKLHPCKTADEMWNVLHAAAATTSGGAAEVTPS